VRGWNGVGRKLPVNPGRGLRQAKERRQNRSARPRFSGGAGSKVEGKALVRHVLHVQIRPCLAAAAVGSGDLDDGHERRGDEADDGAAQGRVGAEGVSGKLHEAARRPRPFHERVDVATAVASIAAAAAATADVAAAEPVALASTTATGGAVNALGGGMGSVAVSDAEAAAS